MPKVRKCFSYRQVIIGCSALLVLVLWHSAVGYLQRQDRAADKLGARSKAAIPAFPCPAVWESMWGMIIPLGRVTQIAAGICIPGSCFHFTSPPHAEQHLQAHLSPLLRAQVLWYFRRIKKSIHKRNQKVKKSQKYVNVTCEFIHTKQTW